MLSERQAVCQTYQQPSLQRRSVHCRHSAYAWPSLRHLASLLVVWTQLAGLRRDRYHRGRQFTIYQPDYPPHCSWLHHQWIWFRILHHDSDIQLQPRQRRNRMQLCNSQHKQLRGWLQLRRWWCLRHAMGGEWHLCLVLAAQQHPLGYYQWKSKPYRLGNTIGSIPGKRL